MRIYITFFLNVLTVYALCGQNLLQQVENSYNSLDSDSYIEELVLSYRNDLVLERCEMDNTTIDLIISQPTYQHLDPIKRQNVIDSLMGYISPKSSAWIETNVNNFVFAVKSNPVHFVLNLTIWGQLQQNLYMPFHVDTSKLRFNLISFDKHNSPIFFVFVIKGKNVEYHSFFPTFSRLVAWNVRKIYKRIMRENPEYLLNCYDLERGNTILYVVRGEIWIYRILQMKKYKLDDYVRQFLS